jgi:hypothetical protein
MAPDDEPPDAFDSDPTNIDIDNSRPVSVNERNTQTYNKSPEFLAGREAGFKEGTDVVIEALKVELVRAGCTKEEIGHIVARIRAGAVLPR